MGVVSLCISLPSGGHTEVIEKFLIPIYQVRNESSLLFWPNKYNYNLRAGGETDTVDSALDL